MRKNNDVSRFSLLLLGVTVILSALLISGLPYGWASLLIVLEHNGVFSDLCINEDVADRSTCPHQVARLNLIFSVGTITALLSSLPVGFLLDYYGEKRMTITGSGIVAFGCYLFGLSLEHKMHNLIFVSYFLLGLGCPCLLMAFMRLSRFFSSKVALFMALLNGSFDASVFVFGVFKYIYEQYHVELHKIFYYYTAVPLLLIISTIMWPDDQPLANHDPTTLSPKQHLRKSNDINNDNDDDYHLQNARLSAWDTIVYQFRSIFSPQFKQDLQSTPYLFGVLYCALHMLFINFYIGTIEIQLKTKLGKEKGLELTEWFNTILPMGLIISPLVGLLLERLRNSVAFFILSLLLLLNGVLNVFPVPFLHFCNFLLFTTCRAYFYAAMANYMISEFGFERFGKLYGINFTFAGFVNSLQNVLLSITVHQLNSNFLPVNLLQIIIATVFFSFSFWLRGREQKRNRLLE